LFIRRVIQHQPNGFIFQTRSARLPALKVLMHAPNPAVYPSEAKPPKESPGSDFLMILRKHLTSAELVDFKKPLSERVLEFVFKTAVPSKELETMYMVVELIPNAPNIILLDSERRVLSSFSPITPQHGISEFDIYALPTSPGKIALERVEELGTDASVPEDLVPGRSGLGPAFTAEILPRHANSGAALYPHVTRPLHAAG